MNQNFIFCFYAAPVGLALTNLYISLALDAIVLNLRLLPNERKKNTFFTFADSKMYFFHKNSPFSYHHSRS